MPEHAVNRLSEEVVVYRGAETARHAWLHVGFAFSVTVGIFVLLPFTEMVAKRPEKQLRIRRVDTVRSELKPPEIERIKRPPEPKPEDARRPEPRAKPQLDVPQKTKPQKLDLPVSLDIGMDFSADFALDFALTPQTPPPVVEKAPPQPSPPPPAAPSVFELGELDRPPKPILRIRPVYPYRARMRNTEGFVEVRFTVDTEGKVKDIDTLTAEPRNVFEATARRAVSRWRFEPGMKDGKAVPVRIQVKLRFTLR